MRRCTRAAKIYAGAQVGIARAGLLGPSSRLASPISRNRCLRVFLQTLLKQTPSFVAAAFARSGLFLDDGGQSLGGVFAGERRSPVSISYSTTPKLKMSARLSTVFPRACSGAM